MPGPFLKWTLSAIVASAALVAGIYFAGGLRFGAPAPDAVAGLLGSSMPDADGREQRFDQWKGKVVVVNFWATWCEPCREEMPQFVKMQRESGNNGLQFVGIAIDQPDKIRKFAAELGLNYPSLVGGYGALELSRTLGNKVMALPFTVILNREGEIAYTQLGTWKTGKLEAIIGKLL
jgi:thiol-disulfide isomerase/thioredoxin